MLHNTDLVCICLEVCFIVLPRCQHKKMCFNFRFANVKSIQVNGNHLPQHEENQLIPCESFSFLFVRPAFCSFWVQAPPLCHLHCLLPLVPPLLFSPSYLWEHLHYLSSLSCPLISLLVASWVFCQVSACFGCLSSHALSLLSEALLLYLLHHHRRLHPLHRQGRAATRKWLPIKKSLARRERISKHTETVATAKDRALNSKWKLSKGKQMSTIKLWVPLAGVPFVLMFPSASLLVQPPLPLPALLSPDLAAFLFLKIEITQP